MEYKQICKAILKKKDKADLLRTWIMLFEKTNVQGWNRDKFLECYIKHKKEMKGGDDNAKR